MIIPGQFQVHQRMFVQIALAAQRILRNFPSMNLKSIISFVACWQFSMSLPVVATPAFVLILQTIFYRLSSLANEGTEADLRLLQRPRWSNL